MPKKGKAKAEAAPPPPPEPEPVQEEPVEEVPPEPEPPQEEPVPRGRGHLGWLYRETFEDLYQPPKPPPQPAVEEKAAEDGVAEPQETSAPGSRRQSEGEAAVEAEKTRARAPEAEDLDFSAEDAEIAALRAGLEQENERLGAALGSLREQHAQAAQQDADEAHQLQQRWGFTQEELVPVGASKLRGTLDPAELQKDGLVHPAGTLRELEREVEIRKGTLKQHENRLAVKKPGAPNHLKQTAVQKHRMDTCSIQPTLTQGQRTGLAATLEDRRRKLPPAPALLSAEERERNREIVKRMREKVSFLGNPRFRTDRGAAARGEACPFVMQPSSVVFQNYEVGVVYELACEFRNKDKVGRRLRVLPCSSPCFSVDALRYDGEASAAGSGAIIAPGMAAKLTVRFKPSSLNDVTEELLVGTEAGDFPLPLLARRLQPRLEFEQPADCGCILAGDSSLRSLRLTNHGGDGSFRLIPGEGEVDLSSFQYETLPDGETTCLTSDAFSIKPASFFLEAGRSIDLSVNFKAGEVGDQSCPLLVECDNGAKTPLTLVGLADAVRLELARWPGRDALLEPQRVEEGISPWSHVPWQLNWLNPGAQVGHDPVPQTIVISNGGYMPITVQWRLAKPSAPLLSRLAVGDLSRVTHDLLQDAQHWSTHAEPSHGSLDCPFSVEPLTAELQPFSKVEFAFSYHAHVPAGRRKTAFAFLEATSIPADGQCLVHYGKLLQLQDQLQPEDYLKGLPLAGGAVSGCFNRVQAESSDRGDTATCTVTAVCLQGVSVRAAVSLEPEALALPETMLPFVRQECELRLRNAGELPVCFRVLSSASGPIWTMSPSEAGPRPEPLEQEAEEPQKRRAAEFLAQWPPLPPEKEGMPGFGASASMTVEPWEGSVPGGGELLLRVTVRALRASEFSGQLLIDLPVTLDEPDRTDGAVPPLEVPVRGCAQMPSAALQQEGPLDFGVVRARAQHSNILKLRNPSDLPMLVRLRRSEEDLPVVGAAVSELADGVPDRASATSSPSFDLPVTSHQEIVELFTSAVLQGSTETSLQVPTTEAEADDLTFKPQCLVLWPHESTEVELTLHAGEVGQHSAGVEAITFDCLQRQCVKLSADVQLPQLRLSSPDCHFPLTYLNTVSETIILKLHNDSDLPASFQWGEEQEPNGDLEVMVNPSKGCVNPRAKMDLEVCVQPTCLPTGGQLAKWKFPLSVQDIAQPMTLSVSAKVYGPEVDYAIMPAGEVMPQGRSGRKKSKQIADGTFQVTTGRARRGLPIVDFGELELLSQKKIHVALYNRTGIGTPFTARVRRYPADIPPPSTGRQSSRSESQPPSARAPAFCFSSQPRAAPAAGALSEEDSKARTQPRASTQSRRSVKFEPRARGSMRCSIVKAAKKKRFLLDDKHEKQSFRCDSGAAFQQQKEEKEQGMAALRQGRGWAVLVESQESFLRPFGMAVVTLTSFCDLPGLFEDELVLNIPELPGHAEGKDFRIPIRQVAVGNPLFLPDQQVGLNLTTETPRLSCGIIVPSEKMTTRCFRLGNNSSAKMSVTWKIYPQRQLESTAQDRQLLSISLCGQSGDQDEEEEDDESATSGTLEEALPDDEMPCAFQIWGQEPPEVKDPFALTAEGDPPIKIEPEEAVIPSHGSLCFSVTMFASKATSLPGNHYSYKLIGKGRFVESLAGTLSSMGLMSSTKPLEQTMVSTTFDSQVRSLPDVPLDPTNMPDSDSDVDAAAPTLAPVSVSELPPENEAHARTSGRSAKMLADKPDAGVVTTVVIDCVGDCIVPRLTVDKTCNESVEDYLPRGAENEFEKPGESEPFHAPVFKFIHSVLAPPKKLQGATHGTLPGNAQIAGVVSHLIRGITLSNATACTIACRFRATGPFRIREIAQLGRAVVKAPRQGATQEPIGQLFAVNRQETVTVQVEFAIDLVDPSAWKEDKMEHTFEGDLIVEYPKDLDALCGETDLQRVHLMGISRRPALRVTLVPRPELDRPLEVSSCGSPVLVDFGKVHVEASVTCSRVVLLSNLSNVVARWQLLHVGRKKKAVKDVGQTLREDEESRASDDKDCFEFDVTEGELMGPTKQGTVVETKERQPHWSLPMPGVMRATRLPQEEQYEPQRLQIAFKPRRNELYKCKFRIQVESGLAVDFVCRGQGSYNEEDDLLDYVES